MPLELRSPEDQTQFGRVSESNVVPNTDEQVPTATVSTSASRPVLKKITGQDRPSLSSLLKSSSGDKSQCVSTDRPGTPVNPIHQSNQVDAPKYEQYDWMLLSSGLVADLKVLFPSLQTREDKLELNSALCWLVSNAQTTPALVDGNLVTLLPSKLTGKDLTQVWKLIADKVAPN